jgi:hypothetical protein
MKSQKELIGVSAKETRKYKVMGKLFAYFYNHNIDPYDKSEMKKITIQRAYLSEQITGALECEDYHTISTYIKMLCGMGYIEHNPDSDKMTIGDEYSHRTIIMPTNSTRYILDIEIMEPIWRNYQREYIIKIENHRKKSTIHSPHIQTTL